MPRAKRIFVSAVVAATAAFTIMGIGPAQAAADGDHAVALSGAATVDDGRAPDRIAGAKAVEWPAARSALATIQARIARYVATHDANYMFGNYVDPDTGRIILNTDAPADLVSSLTDLSGASFDQRQAASQLQLRRTTTTEQLRRTTTTDEASRRDDSPPFFGGAGLAVGDTVCSSGFAVQDSAGTRFMTTAGHCFTDGATVLTESGGQTVGTVSDRHELTDPGATMDVELIGGQFYEGRVFTGGVTSSTSAPVVGAGTVDVGFDNYCHSGRTTGEHCGHTVTATNGQYCGSSGGCASPVIVYTGGTISEHGDSGGAFYYKDTSGGIWICGQIIGGTTTTDYVQPWSVVASALGVSLVTG